MIKKYGKDIIIFLIPFLIFLGYLYIFNPGIMSFDSYYQITQIHTNSFTNWHPFFHTFIELICFKIYDSPISVCFLQILVFSIIWTLICKYFRKDTKISFIIQIIVTLIITILVPINALYAISLSKDTLFSYLLLLLTFIIINIIDKEYEIDKKTLYILSITMAFIWHLRPNGSYIILIFLIIIGIILFIKNKKNYMYIKVPLITIIIVLLISSLNIIFKVENNAKDSLATKVGHMLTYYVQNIEMKDKDITKVNKLVNIKEGKEKFNIYYSDPIYELVNMKEYKKNKTEYFKILLFYTVKNPIQSIKYIFNCSPLSWKIVRGDDWVGGIFYTDINAVNNVENYKAKNIEKKEYQDLNNIITKTKYNKLVSTILYSPALYMYLSFIILIVLYIKGKKYLLSYIPNLLNVLIVTLSIPLQDTRYLYPNILIGYLLLLILIKNINVKKDFI